MNPVIPDSTSEVAGVLLVDKPVGITSFDVVRAAKRALRVKSAGHTGTLDPNASGLLPLCLGDATRIASFITEGPKTYEGVVRFGTETDTLDADGTVVAQADPTSLTREAVAAAVEALVGTQRQIPPMYSARKIAGRRLYELAREGQEVERAATEITVEEARLTAWSPPDATVVIRCSKGTYIRSLAALLGQRLGPGAHLHALRRLASGTFRVEDATPLGQLVALAERDPAAVRARLLSVEAALNGLPELRLDSRSAASVSFGQPLEPGRGPAVTAGTRLRLVDPDGFVVAVGEVASDRGVRLLRVLRARSGPGARSPT